MILKKIILLFLLLICPFSIKAFTNKFNTEIKGTLQGKVVDKVTKSPLAGVNIILLDTEPVRGTTSDINGDFIIENISVGRYDIKIMYMGYETLIFPEILIGSAKEFLLNVELVESPVESEEVVISSTIVKEKPLNDMVLVSGRTFSVEEARRYAGGMDDPARLASSFAGVTTGLTEDNGIVVRGNSPKGILWMLEGIEIPNPNHFFGMTSFGGGGISALSNMMLDNSDFLTGAFPAEYSNALSGVFDLKLKTGNTKQYEHTFQVGLMGIDLASEGALFSDGNSSYAFNYRYSTLGLVSHFIHEDINLPVYQDLSFKLNYPTPNAGTFSLWGIGFIDNITEEADDDTTTWKYYQDREESEKKLNMGTIGLNHKIVLGKNSYLNSTIAATANMVDIDEWELDSYKIKGKLNIIECQRVRLILSTNFYHKFNSNHYNKTGVTLHRLFYNINIKKNSDNTFQLAQIVDEDDNSHLLQGYTESNFRLNEKLKLNLGLSFQYFTLNKNYSIEPRLSLKWDFAQNQSLSLGYGLHSRLEVLNIYMIQQKTENRVIRPNKDLDFTRANHFVLGYDIKLTEHSRLKIEPYYQYLFDVPVIPDSSYSILNMEADWYFNERLNNTGSGKNFGIDITLEKYLYDNYYYLLTTSIFQSKYKGGDGVTRSTRFDRNLAVNLLGGKEWILGENKNKVLGVNLRLQILGGERNSPINYPASIEKKNIVYDETNAFQEQVGVSYHTHVTITYRINNPGHSIIWALQLFNFPSSPDFEGYDYNLQTGSFDKRETNVFFPSLSFKIEF